MGDIIDEHNNFMPVPGNGRAKRARIDREGNFVTSGEVYSYNTTVSPIVRYNLNSASGALRNVNSVGVVAGGSNNSALFAAALLTSNSWYFPPGNYQFNTPITLSQNTVIRGDHLGNTTLQYSDNTPGTTFFTLNGNDSLIEDIYPQYVGTATDACLFGGANLIGAQVHRIQTNDSTSNFRFFSCVTGTSKLLITDSVATGTIRGEDTSVTTIIGTQFKASDSTWFAVETVDTATVNMSGNHVIGSYNNLVSLSARGSVVELPSTLGAFVGNIFVGAGAPNAFVAFADGDATPAVSLYSINYVTANTAPTTITTFDSGVVGQAIFVRFGDANTTLDFTGTTLKGNAGVDVTPAVGDAVRCVYDGTNWICDYIKTTV